MINRFKNIFICIIFSFIITSIFRCDSFNDEGYKNLDTSVRYAGMETCRKCHPSQYETFIETGMGKSFDWATKKKSSAKFSPHSVVYDSIFDFYYHPFWDSDTLKIMEFRLKEKDTVFKRTEKVDYIVGSGQHTNSHLFSTNGYLHQLPVTFYTQQGEWDLAPGFDKGANARFSREIGLECMSCHNALPDFAAGSENKYEKIPSGIDCERCHGPGEIHVKEKTFGILVDTAKEIDYSIVNPAKLPVDLQFDICQRCHLQGNTVLKKGKSFFDFRPGMKLSDVMTVFLPKYENAEDEFIMASHADRLKMSKCFTESEKTKVKSQKINTLKPYKNALTCVTCHNPHVSVKTTGKEIFNNACKNCHTFPLRPPHRGGYGGGIVGGEADCVSCHMPKSGSTDIPHVSITDHFIRKPGTKNNIEQIKKFIKLVAINEKSPAPEILAEGYMNQYEKFGSSAALLDSAEKYLSAQSVEEIKSNFNLLVRLYFLKNDFEKIIFYSSKFPFSVLLNELLNQVSYSNEDAWTCYRIAEAFAQNGKINDAFLFYKKATELAPLHPDFLNKLAGTLMAQNKRDEAKNIYEKIIVENPKIASAWCNLGFICFLEQDFGNAEENYSRALALDPDYELAWLNKAQLYLTQGRKNEAKNILLMLLEKNPKNEKVRSLLKKVNS